MNLSSITPVVLTFNEAPNVGRTLAAVSWANDVIVLDSYSDDGTLEIARNHPNVRVFQRHFDCHANQWNFAVENTGIVSEWILSLDADYVLTEPLIEEIRGLSPPPNISGYLTEFDYCIYGTALRGSVYPAVITLFRREHGKYRQDGHTQRLALEGEVARLEHRIRHDDRKSMSRWLASQSAYMDLEVAKLLSTPNAKLGHSDRLRKAVVIAPPLVFLYSLFWRGAILDGKAGLYYALQRTVSELILSLRLLQHYLGVDKP